MTPTNARIVLDVLKFLASCANISHNELESVRQAIAITQSEVAALPVEPDAAPEGYKLACIGDSPSAPYPGMIAAFESHYGQSFADKDWRDEASVWAAAWKAAKAHSAAQEPTK